MKLVTTLGFILGLAVNSQASFTLSFQAGRAFAFNGQPVVDGTPYALLVSADNTFAGDFGLNGSLSEQGANATFSSGQTLSKGDVLGGDTVFGVGLFNGVDAAGEQGLVSNVLVFNLGENGLATNLKYAFYFFPGGNLVAGAITIASEVGGINSDIDSIDAGLLAMTIPGDTAAIATGAATVDFGGQIANKDFTAVELVPEPSTLLLSALGVLGLLRRKR